MHTGQNLDSPFMPRSRSSYAIPMPYIPSSSNKEGSSGTRVVGGSTSSEEEVPAAVIPDINIELLTERRSSYEVARLGSSVGPVQSTAVVKYSDTEPAPLARLQQFTDLNRPPDNWLRDKPGTKGFVPTSQIHDGFTAFGMANDFLDCLSDVDVVSDGENIKKLLKMPYSKTPISMVVHRVGKTLLLDDFDIHRYLLRRSANEWEWIRKFFSQNILQQRETQKDAGAVTVRKNSSSTALQERNLVSKFLYRTLENKLQEELEEEVGVSEEAADKSEISLASLSIDNLPPLPEPEENHPSFTSEKFARNLLWTFEDIRMLIGSNMPIFGDNEHPSVSLRLRDMKKPINILTGMDYWLDNLMCQVPEVLMCYHLDGIVQKYELIQTEDLPSIEGSKFSPKIVKNIAQNVLSFLKSNVAKEGHTYWLFKGKDDEIVKLYDLTSISQKDAGIKPTKGTGSKEEPTSPPPESSAGNPFQTPVSMLLYRLARNILEAGDRKEEEGTVRELLQNCVELLDSEKFPHIATSAHFLLSELYVPEDTDPAQPAFCGPVSNPDDLTGEKKTRETECDDISLDVSTLCQLPGNMLGLMSEEKRSPPISATVEGRCMSALRHIEQGLRFLSSLEERKEKMEKQLEKERERRERENIKMSVPNKPIPMGYTGEVGGRDMVQRTRSISEGNLALSSGKSSRGITWTEYLKFLLLKKSLLVYITMAEVSFHSKHLGRTLKCIKRAVNCHSMVESLGGPTEGQATTPVISFALGVAGDCYMALVTSWSDMPVYQEQYNCDLPAEAGIAREVERYTHELDRDWTIRQPRDIQDAMELAVLCYTRSLEMVGEKSGDRTSLVRRLANVENELGVFFMNQATALVQKISTDEDDLAVTALAGAQDLFNCSRKYLNQGIAKFESIADLGNTALLLSNSGRLSRLAGHAIGLKNCGVEQEFQGEEAEHYKNALDYYQQALQVLGSKKTCPHIWDSVTWELSSTLFTVGTLLQDHAPLSRQPRDQVEREVTEYMSQALKYIDIESRGPRQEVFQLRGAVIHHRLASLYHHSYRCYSSEDSSPRKKKLKQLSDLHYVKASFLFLVVDRFGEYLRTVLERAGLAETGLPSIKTDSAKHRSLLTVLDVLLEAGPGVGRLADKMENQEIGELADEASPKPENDEENSEEIKMLDTLVKRIQFTLLSLVKLGNVKKNKGRKTDISKELYASSLKCSNKSDNPARATSELIVKVAGDKHLL